VVEAVVVLFSFMGPNVKQKKTLAGIDERPRAPNRGMGRWDAGRDEGGGREETEETEEKDGEKERE
jgi:hypothetical protein